MKMRKTISLLLATLTFGTLFTSCAKGDDTSSSGNTAPVEGEEYTLIEDKASDYLIVIYIIHQ